MEGFEMKIRTVLAGAFAALALTACAVPATANFPVVPEGLYPTTFVVTEVTPSTERGLDVITVETATGIEYRFFSDAGDWLEGDLCAAIMHDTGTENDVRDDMILSTQYTGIPLWFEDASTRP